LFKSKFKHLFKQAKERNGVALNTTNIIKIARFAKKDKGLEFKLNLVLSFIISDKSLEKSTVYTSPDAVTDSNFNSKANNKNSNINYNSSFK
jgi:hypothetical protein